MATLLGIDDPATFTANLFFGFGGGNSQAVGIAASQAGSATTLFLGINDFGANTLIRFGLYEQVGGAGAINLVATADFTDSGAGDANNVFSAALSSAVTLDPANLYFGVIWGDDSVINGGSAIQMKGITATLPEGWGSATSAAYDPPSSVLTLSGAEAGNVFWYLDGTASGGGTINTARVFLEEKGSPGTIIQNRQVQVRVFDLDFNLLDSVLTFFNTGSNGEAALSSTLIPTAGTEVLVAVRDESISELDGKDRVVRVLTETGVAS